MYSEGDVLWQLHANLYRKLLRLFALTWRPVNTTTAFQFLPTCVRVFSALRTACSEVRQTPRISCMTFGCGGSLRVGAQLRTRPRSWRRQPHDCVSTSPSPL